MSQNRQLRDRLASSGRIRPVEMDILPSSPATHGMVATIPADEIMHNSPRDFGNAGRLREHPSLTSQEFHLQGIRRSSGNMSFPKNMLDTVDPDKQYQGELRQFVRQHFHKKECSKFVPDPNQKAKTIREVKCHCGAVLLEHAGMLSNNPKVSSLTEQFIVPKELQRIFRRESLNQARPEKLPKLQWSKEMIRRTVTCSFGKIDFINVEHAGGKKPAKYIRISDDDSVDSLFELMQDYWGIMEPHKPNLVISVVGGAKNFKLDGRMRTTFESGLIKTAKTTSAWLISSGFNMGVMKAVGQAVRQGQSFCWDNDHMMHVLRCIGIAPWGYVRHRKVLESESGQGKFCANYRTSNVILHGEPVPLNADHTHFIFVDDGYKNRYKGVADMRAKVEQKISTPETEGGLGIPVVLVVVEGGIDAIADAKTSLEHKIPVVVCSGTGRAADILAYAYSHIKTVAGSQIQMSEKHRGKLMEKISDAYGRSWAMQDAEKKTIETYESVMICCQNAHLMTVFNMNKADELDLAILTCLLKAQSGANEQQRLSQLKLALTWDRVDIAQEEIFREDVLWRQGSLDGVLTDAIVGDQVKFIQLILEQGVIMKEFLTLAKLNQLYQKVPKHHAVYKMLYKLTGKNELNLDSVVEMLQKLLDKFDKEELIDYEPPDRDVENTGQLKFQRPYKHLLLYSVLLHRQALAIFCWEMGEEPVTTAVAVTQLYQSIGQHITRYESSLRDVIDKYKQEFEQLSTSVLEECSRSDPDKAQMIVERKSPVWHGLTSLQVAVAANDLQYLSAEACQNSIMTTWKQGVVAGYKQLLLCILCPFLILCSIEFANVGGEPLTWYQKLATFYTSPVAKFCHGTLLYLVFLVVHSYMVLVDFDPGNITTIEIICVIWVLTFAMDKLYTFIHFPASSVKAKVRDWYGIVNWLETINYLICFIGFIVHLAGYPSVTKVMYCMNSVAFFIVVTKFYTASANVGPKLVMIQRMMGELALFLCVVFVFLLAYGIASQGLLYHERSSSWTILKDVIYFPYWQLYGEIFFEGIAADGEPADNSTGGCVSGERDCMTFHWLVPFLLAAYLMVGNILLLNLLIAIFSNVFHQVEKNSIEIWKYQMYILVMEFDNKTCFVPPFSIMQHLLLTVRWVVMNCCRKRIRRAQLLGRRHLEYLQLFEKEMMMNFLRRQRASELLNIDTRVQSLEKRVEMLTKLIEEEVITDQQPEGAFSRSNTIVMNSEMGAVYVDQSLSVDSGLGHPWPCTADVLGAQQKIQATPIPLEYYTQGKVIPQMIRTNTGTLLVARQATPHLPRMNTSPNLLGQGIGSAPQAPKQAFRAKDDMFAATALTGSPSSSPSKDIPNKAGKTESDVKEGRKDDIETDKTKTGENVLEKQDHENLADPMSEHGETVLYEGLTEKEIRKLRKKEEKRLRKEEKRRRREADKQGQGHGLHGDILGMNDINRPGSQEGSRASAGADTYLDHGKSHQENSDVETKLDIESEEKHKKRKKSKERKSAVTFDLGEKGQGGKSRERRPQTAVVGSGDMTLTSDLGYLDTESSDDQARHVWY